MNDDMLIKFIEEFNSKNILLTLSKNEIDDNLLNYLNNSQSIVTILDEEISDIHKENINIKEIPVTISAFNNGILFNKINLFFGLYILQNLPSYLVQTGRGYAF